MIIIFALILLILITFIIRRTKEGFEDIPSFHILMATMGKESIFKMLDSLKKQLRKNDYLTIVFDGPELPNVDKIKQFTSDFNCKVNVIVEDTNLGYWGHAIRNKHNQLPGDFVFHIDDDDNIASDCMETLRKTCKNQNTIYIFKMNNKGDIIWNTKEIILGEIGTPMGIIPVKLNSTSVFTYKYGGDYDFYKKLEENGNQIEYVDKVIYIVRP